MGTGSPDTTFDLPPDTAALVVASHGHGEEMVLAAALAAKVPYVALVASRKRGDAVLAGVGADRDRVHTPAGIDVGAHTASDVAISILAEIIATRPAPPPLAEMAASMITVAGSDRPTATSAEPEVATDPVCGMDVAVTPLALQAEHGGQTYYFCGSGCKVAFTADPHRYLTGASHG
jgi:xanthine dehydrogenase accessory factor